MYMIRPAAFLLAVLPLAAAAQESLGHDGDLAMLTATVKALADAPTDAKKDSVSAALKEGLRVLLDADDAFARDLSQLPLSRVDAPDGLFRLITWNVPYGNGTHRYEGFLLVKERKRRVLHELHDMTGTIPSPETPALGTGNWYGALYYAVIPVKHGGKTLYTLLGWKGHTGIETRKVIDVLSFKGGTPSFGAPLFGEGRVKKMRRVFAYSFQATMSLQWDADRQWIICDHLSPQRADLEGQWAFYGPDLSYDAFRWDRRQWVYQRDVDVRGLRDGKPYNPPPRNTP